MEFTPAVFISLGAVPGAGLARFKQEAVWRPAPIRQLVRAVCLGEEPPAPTGPGARAVHAWTAGECRWLPPGQEPWGDDLALRALLRETLALTMSAANLEAVRALPGHSVFIREHREAFGPEVCLLVDALSLPPLSLSRLLHTVAAGLGRTLTLVLVLPDQLDPRWPEARELVRQTARHHGPDLLDRVWLVSREQETGELLEDSDLADALSYFCHLFAFTGWPADPGLRRYFIPEPGGEGGRLATFGVKGERFSAPTALFGELVAEGRAELDRLLDPGAPVAPDLAGALAAARAEVRRTTPEVPLPTGAEPLPESWYALAKLRWAPRVQALAEAVVERELAPFQKVGGLPAARLAAAERLLAAVRDQQTELPRPEAPPDIAPAFERLAELRKLDRWPPLVWKGLISTVLSGALAWVFFPAGSAEPAAILMASAWAVLLVALAGINLRDRRRALAALQGAGRAWGAAYLEGLTYAQTLHGLHGLAGLLTNAHAGAQTEVARLRAERHELDQEAAAPPLPPPRTAVSQPAPGHWSPTLGPAAEPTAVGLLARPWAPGPGAMEEPAFRREGPAPLLLPVRKIQPNDGSPLRTVTFASPAEDPFLRARFTLTGPFAIPGSARLEEREVEA